MAKKKATKRPKTYEPKLQLKESVELNDLVNLALRSKNEDKPKAKKAKGKK